MVDVALRRRGSADRIFTNAAVFRAGGAEPADTVAVRDGTIVSVSRGVDRDMIGNRTDITDLGGASLLPGFVDAHAHPVAAGMAALRCDLSGLPHRREAYLAAVADYARNHPDEAVITGAGWYGDAFADGFPTRQDTDSVVADRPVILTSHDYHGAWVNTCALESAGIDVRTADPTGGRIIRDHDGFPTGVLLDRAGDAVNALIPEVTSQFMRRALIEAQRRLHSVGVTGWQDAAVGAEFFGLKDNFATYVDADEAGELTARVVGALWWQAEQGVEQLGDLCARRDRTGHSRFTATMVKVMQDGICENCTAAMLAPYRAVGGHDIPSGQSFIDPQDLKKATAVLAAERFGIHMHAVGDRAVRECLDALEYAISQNPTFDGRHQIAHLDVVDPQDIPRFGQLGVIANIQALWARRDKEIVERKLPLLGPDREPWHFPFASLQRHGATLAMGSDWPVTDPNPLWAIHTAVHRTGTRADPHAIGDDVFDIPLQPQEAITLPSALQAYTAGSAYANGQDRTGRIADGMLADLVVLDRNVLAADDIGAVRPVETIVGGRTVYRAA
ncbi:amidohydrolase [Mycolicibacterium goodii]|uniref:Amidohydrolase n=1 Tax=Mycolicibacterium goodii TaxID=134601 RepID=A0ABS6HKM7_MYCGD|nr:amidohydrolase [Mycolicibacterium goodii]MBU8821933.1 amidohydrolase [Mycolicibacterium goodii]MBU8838713.1 amidohydrolase [Mycolicibacterium goodii]OKH63371.1 peptidase [Mycobacterium sp. SWH-M5]